MITVNKIDVPPSVFPLLGCTDTYGKVDNHIGTQLLYHMHILLENKLRINHMSTLV